MHKDIKAGAENRKKILDGIRKLAGAVVSTLGPKGRHVAINNNRYTYVVRDGVSVAKAISLQDPFENIGAAVVRGAASKTNDVAGDGTTTSTLLAEKIIEIGFRLIESNVNPIDLKRGMDLAFATVIEELDKLKTEIKTTEELVQVSTISAGTVEIGQKVAEALAKVGKDGVITVKESLDSGIEVVPMEGMEIENGALLPLFVTNDRMEVEIEKPVILITEKKLGDGDEMVEFLRNTIQVSKNIVIIADEVDGDALKVVVENHKKHTINCCVVKAPGFGDRKLGILQDLATITGGTVITDEEATKISSPATVNLLGKAEMFWADRDKSRIVGGVGLETDIDKRIKYLREKAKTLNNEFDRQKTLERAAAMESGICTINVGASTEVERKDKLERVKDAVGATRAAQEDGIVPGGGVALLRARESLNSLISLDMPADIRSGIMMVYEALGWPIKQIVQNAGLGERVLVKVEEGSGNFGYDVTNNVYGDMINMGIIDPVKVTKSALENAISVSGLLLITDHSVVDIPDPIATDSRTGAS